MLESKIESTVVKYARKKGFLVVKYKDDYQTGSPDRQLTKKRTGEVFYIEFKKLGEKPEPHQLKYHEMLYDDYSKFTFIVDSIELGKMVIDSIEKHGVVNSTTVKLLNNEV